MEQGAAGSPVAYNEQGSFSEPGLPDFLFVVLFFGQDQGGGDQGIKKQHRKPCDVNGVGRDPLSKDHPHQDREPCSQYDGENIHFLMGK